nr:hypothetical protein Iba_chr06cCG9560 [Ipomoea batatas]
MKSVSERRRERGRWPRRLAASEDGEAEAENRGIVVCALWSGIVGGRRSGRTEEAKAENLKVNWPPWPVNWPPWPVNWPTWPADKPVGRLAKFGQSANAADRPTGRMSQDDSQNFFAHDYDDLIEDEFCVSEGGSPNRSDDAQQVRARLVAPIQSVPSQILLKKRKIQTNDSTSSKVKETPLSKSITPSGDYVELDPKGAFGTPVEISPKEEEQLADLIGEGIRYEVDRRLTNIVSVITRNG